jgi:hypothetical protein
MRNVLIEERDKESSHWASLDPEVPSDGPLKRANKQRRKGRQAAQELRMCPFLTALVPFFLAWDGMWAHGI